MSPDDYHDLSFFLYVYILQLHSKINGHRETVSINEILDNYKDHPELPGP